MFFIFMFVHVHEKYHCSLLKKKWITLRRFEEEEDTPMVNQDEDCYDDYRTSRINKKPFMEPDATEATSTLRLRQKLNRDYTGTLT